MTFSYTTTVSTAATCYLPCPINLGGICSGEATDCTLGNAGRRKRRATLLSGLASEQLSPSPVIARKPDQR